MNDEVILKVEKLKKSYEIADKNNTILKEIDLQVKKGEFVAIMGHSGSGKSTLLYCISGMDKISSGSVKYNNKELEKLSDDEISNLRLMNMGFVFQNSCLLKDFTILENIMLPCMKAGKTPKADIRKKANNLMKQVQIENIAGSEINQVSGGQLQRAAICRALINEPDILFADEPIGALNSKSTFEIMDIFNQVNNSGTTIVMVTHDIKVAVRASRIIYLADGAIKQEFSFTPWKNYQESGDRESILMHCLQSNGF